MRIIIVGQRNGKAVVQWSRFLGLAIVLSMIWGLGAGFVFSVFAGYWSHKVVLTGIACGAAMVSIVLLIGLRTPPEKLTPLDR